LQKTTSSWQQIEELQKYVVSFGAFACMIAC